VVFALLALNRLQTSLRLIINSPIQKAALQPFRIWNCYVQNAIKQSTANADPEGAAN